MIFFYVELSFHLEHLYIGALKNQGKGGLIDLFRDNRKRT